MTVGPGIVFMALTDRPLGKIAQRIIVFGRVPMLYYLLHAPLIHVLAVLVGWRNSQVPLGSFLGEHLRPGYGYNLAVVYGMWIVTVLLLPTDPGVDADVAEVVPEERGELGRCACLVVDDLQRPDAIIAEPPPHHTPRPHAGTRHAPRCASRYSRPPS